MGRPPKIQLLFFLYKTEKTCVIIGYVLKCFCQHHNRLWRESFFIAKSAWAKFAAYISFHGGLFLGPMNDGAPFVEMFRLLISEEECELGMHIPAKPTSAEEIAASAKVPVDKAAALLKHMSQKGACFERVTGDGKCFYNITPVHSRFL